MIDNVFKIKRQSQVKALGSEIKLKIIQHLMETAQTCQELSQALGVSKQKVHYNLRGLLEEELIVHEEVGLNDKEKHYRARAHNYVIDFSMGREATKQEEQMSRGMIERILRNSHGIELERIAEGIVNNSIGIQPGERLLIVSGRFNLPLVEYIQSASASIGAEVSLLYRDQEFLRRKHEEFSIEAYRRDYENFNRLLSEHDVYLYLNGESRYLDSCSGEKLIIRQESQKRSLEIIDKQGIRVVMMPGLLNDSLDEENIRRELNFWRALDVDYGRLRRETDSVIAEYANCKGITVRNWGKEFNAEISSIFGEYGSFGESPYQSNTINLPGGEVLLLPRRGSVNGVIKGSQAYIKGRKVESPEFEIKDSKITGFKSRNENELISEALSEGGKDGREIALFCIGTNYNIPSDSRDLHHINKSKGLLTVYWGNNTMLGGSVRGKLEWQVQIEKPKIKTIKRSEK